MFARLGLLSCLALASVPLAGCSFETFAYTVDRYGTVNGVHVRLGCHDTYEVFDRPTRGTLVVVTNGVNEAIAAGCATGSSAAPRPERMRRVAEIFLAEKTDRPECAIVRATELSDLHTEFGYRCPPGERDRPPPPRARRG